MNENNLKTNSMTVKDPEFQLQIINYLQKLTTSNNSSIFSFSLYDLQQTVCNGPNDDLMEVCYLFLFTPYLRFFYLQLLRGLKLIAYLPKIGRCNVI